MTSGVRGWVLGGAMALALVVAPHGALAESAPAAAPSTHADPSSQRGGAEQPRSATAPEKAPRPGGEGGPSEGKAEQDAKPSKHSSTGGYSWGDPPRKAAKKMGASRPATTRKRKVDRSAPVATFPGFRMLPDGGSVVWVRVSREVPVRAHEVAGRLSYLLAGARVEVVNNTHPLVTTHFATPVERIRLVPVKAGVELAMELREPVKPVLRVVKGPREMMMIEVELPAANQPVPKATTAPLEVRGGSGAPKTRARP